MEKPSKDSIFCPYFHGFQRDGHGVICAGFMPGTAETVTRFPSKEEAADHFQYNCCSEYYRGCPVADMIEYAAAHVEEIQEKREKMKEKADAYQALIERKVNAERKRRQAEAAQRRNKKRRENRRKKANPNPPLGLS